MLKWKRWGDILHFVQQQQITVAARWEKVTRIYALKLLNLLHCPHYYALVSAQCFVLYHCRKNNTGNQTRNLLLSQSYFFWRSHGSHFLLWEDHLSFSAVLTSGFSFYCHLCLHVSAGLKKPCLSDTTSKPSDKPASDSVQSPSWLRWQAWRQRGGRGWCEVVSLETRVIRMMKMPFYASLRRCSLSVQLHQWGSTAFFCPLWIQWQSPAFSWGLL